MKPLLKKILRPLLAISLSVSGVAVIATAVAASKEQPVETKADVSSYYSGISDSATGTTLQNALHSLNESKRTSTVGYAGMRTFAATCDIDPDGSGKIIGFYDNAKIGPSWDSGSTWNREHVWPNARGGSSVEADAHMIRPASTSTNSGRGSKGFGTESFDPGSSVAYYRGVAARIIFYCAIANTSLKITDDVFDSDYSSSDPANTMGTLSDLLRWNLQYLPTDTSFSGANDLARRTEINRNNIIEQNSAGQGNRNPFIDHPEYACRIWGSTNSTTQSICNSSSPSVGVSISESSKTVAPGASFTLSATSTAGGTINWTTSNSSVASLSSSTSTSGNNITITAGSSTGTATITAKQTISGTQYSATCAVTVSSSASDTYTRLTSISSIDNNAQYVLGIDGTGFHYSGTSSWGSTALPTAQTPLYYTLTKNSGNTSFTAKTKVDNTDYYLTVPTSNTFTMSTSSSNIKLGTTATDSNGDVDYAVANTSTTARHLRINGTSGLRSYANSNTGTMAYFYKVESGSSDPSATITPASASVTVGNTVNLSATLSNVTSASNITWTSSSTSIATVSKGTTSTTSSAATVTGVAAGTATIYCKHSGTTIGSATVTVTAAKTLSSIAVKTAPTKTSYTAGEYFAPAGLVITLTYSDSSTENVTYSSSNASSFTFTPDTSTALTTSHTSVTITYGGKSCNQAITVTSSGGSSSTEYFQKVTSASALTSGDYLIVYETGNLAFNGGLSTIDAKNNSIAVTISDSKIDATTTTKAAKFTINTTAGTIKSASGYYIGNSSSSSNQISTSTSSSAYTNTITYNSGDVDIVSNSTYLRYNANSTDLRFRYYKSSSYANQQAIQLYKYITTSTDSVSLNKDSLSLVMGGSAGSITATASGTVVWTTSDANVATVNNGAVTAVGTGVATITATCGTASATCAVIVTGATGTSPYVNGIPYKMYLTNSSNYFFTGSMGTGNQQYYGMTSTTYGDGVDVYFEANGTGQNIYTLSGNTKTYFYVVTSGNFVNFKHDVTSAPETAWVYDSTASCIAFPIDGVKYTFGNSGTYTTFSAYNVDVNTSNYNVQFGLTGEGYAKIFYDAISCDSTGNNAPTFNSGYTWTSLGTLYNGLLDGAKSELQSATANESGSTYLEKATYRYDYIIAKYGVTSYANFMSRTVKTLPMSANFFSSLNSESSTAIIVIASLVGLTSAFGLLMLRKRKED